MDRLLNFLHLNFPDIMAWQFVVFVTACALVGLACLVPNRWLPRLPNDKLLHFGAFSMLAALALPLAANWTEGALWLGGLFIGGWLIECLQGRLVPDRSFCWRDIAANGGGICFTALCALALAALQS